MLTRVVEVDNLDRTGKMEPGQVPDPLGAVAQDDFLCGATPAAFPSFQVEPFAKLLSGFDGPGVGSGMTIPNGEAFLVPGSLGEHATQLGFAIRDPHSTTYTGAIE